MLQILVTIVAGLVGLNFLVHAWIERRKRPDLSGATLLDGEVVDLQASPIQRPRTGWRAVQPVVTYRTPEGELKRFTSSVGRYPSPYTVGQKVVVRHLQGNDAWTELAAEAGSLDRGWLHYLLFGVLFCGVGAAVALLID